MKEKNKHQTDKSLGVKSLPVQTKENVSHNGVNVKGSFIQRSLQEQAKLESPKSSSLESKTKMPSVVQTKMENSFQTDFSDVNIHQGDSATEMNALAYTQGNDIHFAPGQYNPESLSGQQLLGHELTHVVQQKNGNIQPTTQLKGVGINDDKGLEEEADEMGAKAALGKSVSVSGASQNIQRKEGDKDPTIDITVQENTLSPNVVVPGMTYLGSFSFRYSISSDQRMVQYLLTGSKDKWAKVLEYADDSGVMLGYIYAFLKASNDPSWIKYGDENRKTDAKIEISRAPNDNEKLEFLKALYGVEVESKLDLVDNAYEKGILTTERFTTPEIAEFIQKHQHLLVNYVSKKKEDQQMSSAGIKTLAEQGTPDTFNPVLVKSMMQSAFASAVSATKIILSQSIKGHGDITSSIDAYDMVVNSAIILKGALDSYGSKIKDLQDEMGGIFDNVWGAIPIPGGDIGKAIAGKAQEYLKQQLVSSMNLPNTEDLKETYRSKYSSFVKTTCDKMLNENKDTIDKDKLSVLYMNLINGFATFLK